MRVLAQSREVWRSSSGQSSSLVAGLLQDSREISIENRNPSPVIGANMVKSSEHDAHLLNGGSVRWLVILE
jgi:hypothetical protein